jgi:hypothetical protein
MRRDRHDESEGVAIRVASARAVIVAKLVCRLLAIHWGTQT